MSTTATATLIFLGAWMAVLTLVVLLLVRQVALLSVRLSLPDAAGLMANDGPELDSTVPEEVQFMTATSFPDRVVLVAFSAGCAPCREIAVGLNENHFDSALTVLLQGEPEMADPVAAVIPDSFDIVRDPDANRIVEALRIRSVPFAVVAEKNVVIAKAYLHTTSDLLSLAQGATSVEDPSRESVIAHVS